ncbi:MAG: CoA ester lyase [Pseudomonadales bacterium]
MNPDVAALPRPAGVHRLRRSLHFVPGASEKMLGKSLATAADGLVLDLEDAVTPDRKDDARGVVSSWLRDVDFGGKERTVRINPLDSPWGEEDVRATMAHPPDAFVVPKVSTLDELRRLDEMIGALEREHGHPQNAVGLILVSTETPLGVLNLPTFPECPRVIALSWGAEDLSAAIGAPTNRLPGGAYLDLYRHCRVQTLLCATAAAVQAVDTVFVDIQDHEALERECREAAWMGYTGKITIHPAQIDIVNAAFTPSAAEVAESERLLAAFAEAEVQGRMAFAFEGRMVDVPHLNRARRILARARQIREQS